MNPETLENITPHLKTPLRMVLLTVDGIPLLDSHGDLAWPDAHWYIHQGPLGAKDNQRGRLDSPDGPILWESWPVQGPEPGSVILMFLPEAQKDARTEELERLRFHEAVIDQLVETAYEGLVVVDAHGNITKCKYEKLLGIKEKDVVGRPVSEVIENTRLHEVIRTGRSEIGQVQTINGHDMIASRIPVSRNGVVIGAVGTVLFKDVKEVKALANRLEKLESKVKTYEGEINRLHQAKYTFDHIITRNTRMRHLIDLARKAADSHSTVLLEGESGTGKEYFSHAIHKASYRSKGPFVQINCAAIPRELIEAELFGYVEGAFTGASKGGKLGKFELANGGTLFLDEVGTLPLDMQAKLLRVLEEREYERIGGNQKIAVDIRVIAATNEHLSDMVQKGKFREDLYYRLNVLRLFLPPLRERKEDIPLLAEHILENFCNQYGKLGVRLSTGAMERLQSYDWPGNVRELRNAMERALMVSEGRVLYTKDLPDIFLDGDVLSQPQDDDIPITLEEAVEAAEADAIRRALLRCDGSRTEAAKLLGIHRTGLHKKIRQYGIV